MLNFLSFTWAGLAITLALAVPRMNELPTWARSTLTVIALTTTTVLILSNLLAAWIARRQAGRLSAALPRTLLALGLFNLLFVQVACHLGANHFESSTAPGPEDWLVFGASHVLRAADVVDAIEKLELNIQSIRHNSPLVAMLLIAFHLVTGLIVLEVLGQAFRAVKNALMGTADRVALKAAFLTCGWILVAIGGGATMGLIGLRLFAIEGAEKIAPLPTAFAILAATLVLAAFLYRRRGPNAGQHSSGDVHLGVSFVDLEGKLLQDLGADHDKPLSRFIVAVGAVVGPVLLVGLCVVVASILDGVKLYGVPAMSLWVLDNILRVFDFADIMALFEVRTHQVAGFWGEAMSAIVLRLIAAVVLGAVVDKLLRRNRDEATDTERKEIAFAWKGVAIGVAVCVLVVAAPFLVVSSWPGWTDATRQLTTHLDDPARRADALDALRRMGPHAASAVPALKAQLEAPDREEVIRTLGALGPSAVPVLESDSLNGNDDSASALGRVRPVPVSSLVRVLVRNEGPTREAVQQSLRGLGRRAVPELRRNLTPANAKYLVPVLEELEPYWYVPRFDDPELAKQVRHEYVAAKQLR